MLKYPIIIGLTFFSIGTFSQSKIKNEIVSEGASKIKVRPDLATFTLTVEKRDTSEKNVIKLLNSEIDELVKSLYQIGFTNNTIKISDYDISSSEDNNERKRYHASNVLKLEFGLNTKLIDALYKEIQEAGLRDLDISFETKVSDSLEKATRIKLVQYAIEDAKINANNIAKTLELKLLNVKQVLKYRESILGPPGEINQVKFNSPKIINDNETRSNTSFDKFQVEDVELEEKITIIFEISKLL